MKKVFEEKSHNLYSSKSSVHVYVVKKGRNTPTSSVTLEGHVIKGKEGVQGDGSREWKGGCCNL